MAQPDELMNKPGKTGLARVIAATGYSLQGLRAAWRHEEAFRIEAVLCCACLPLAWLLGQSLVHRLLLIVCCALVLLAELTNSALEAVVDRIGPERHPLAGRAKDIGSAGVFVTLVLFVLVWGASLWDRLA